MGGWVKGCGQPEELGMAEGVWPEFGSGAGDREAELGKRVRSSEGVGAKAIGQSLCLGWSRRAVDRLPPVASHAPIPGLEPSELNPEPGVQRANKIKC